MDHSEVQRVVEAHLPRMVAALGVARWRVKFAYVSSGPDDQGSLTRGECTMLLDYDRACITVNPQSLADEAEVLDVLRHELLHLVLAPMNLYAGVVDAVDRPDAAALARVWDHAIERTVLGLEAMLDMPRPPGPPPAKGKRR